MAKRLILLNALAVIAAVVNHAVAWDMTAMFWWADQYRVASIPDLTQFSSLRYLVLRLIDPVVVVAVPAFLFISGLYVAMAAGRTQPRLAWSVVWGRMKYLLPPYLLWSTVLLLARVVQGENFTAWGVARVYLEGTAAPPYYYVPLLIQLYLLAPFLVAWAHRRPLWLLAASGLLQVIVIGLTYGFLLDLGPFFRAAPVRMLINWNLPAYLPWFALGMVASFHAAGFRTLLQRARPFLLIAAGALFVLGQIEWSALRERTARIWLSPSASLSYVLFLTVLLLAFLSVEQIDRLHWPDAIQLARKSYGIYLIHVPVLEFTARAIYHLAPGLLAYQLPFMAILLAAGLGLPYLVIQLLGRSVVRRYSVYAFG